MENEIWEAAEFITEWDHEGLRFKALFVPREAIDEDSEEYGALLVIGLDSGNVRRYEELFDPAYCRMGREDRDMLAELLEHAPEEVRECAENIRATK